MEHTSGYWYFRNGTVVVEQGRICDVPPPSRGGVLEFAHNGTLIAAAPDLLYALKMALPHLEAVAHKDNAAYTLARAAIERAEGK